jgi:hypothetical protein
MTGAPATADHQRLGRIHEPSCRQEPAASDVWTIAAYMEAASRDATSTTSGATMPVHRVEQRRAFDMMCD